MIAVVAKNFVKEKKLEEFLRLSQELVAETRREEGCIEYLLMRDSERTNVLTFIEKWETVNHLKNHFETPHFKRIIPIFEELVEAEGDITIYEEL